MVWFRVDDTLAFHAKVVAAGNAAMGLWVRAGSWAAQQLTDGFVPAHMATALGTRPQAKALVNAGLWTEVEGGFQFHQWSDEGRQPTREKVESDRVREREKKRSQRRDAGGKFAGVPDLSPGDTPGDSRQESARPDPARPDPVPTYVGTAASSKSRARSEAAGGSSTLALLSGHGLDEHQRDDFLAYLAQSSDKPSRLVPWLHTHGELAERIEQWRIDTKATTASRTRAAPTDRQAQILRAEMERAKAADAATNVVHLPQIGAGS